MNMNYHGKGNPRQRQCIQGLAHLVLVVVLLLSPTAPSSKQTNRITWSAVAMNPPTDAVATAALLRRNVLSGAAIFTVGDIAAQMLTLSKKNRKPSASTIPPVGVEEMSESSKTQVEKVETETIHSKNIPEFASLLQKRIRQLVQHTVLNLDKNRLYSATVLGAIWSGFCVPFVYGSVEQRFPGKATVQQVVIKMLVTCSILSTIGNYATIFARRFVAQCIATMSLKPGALALVVQDCWKSCNKDIGEVILDDLKIWPLYDLACYGLIPPNWRPITTSIMSSGWAMYMSVVSAKETVEKEERKEPIPDATVTVTTMKPFEVAPLLKDEGTSTSETTSETTKRLIAVAGGTSTVPNADLATPISKNSEDINDEDEDETTEESK
jgi:hypothetical protein